MIILDTDVLIEIFDKHSAAGKTAMDAILARSDTVATTAINLHEILYGLEKYARPTVEILQLPILGYAKEDSRLSVKLEVSAERAGKPIRRTDAMIAAIAMRSEAEFYTLNLKHFAPLKSLGLKMFNP